MAHVTQEEATANLPGLIDKAAQTGEAITILRNNIAVARIVPVSETADTNAKPRPQFGSARGLIWMSEDFDAPLEDFATYTSKKPVLGTAEGQVWMAADFDAAPEEFAG